MATPLATRLKPIDLFIGFGTDFWGASLFILPSNYILIDSEFIPVFYKLLPLIFTVLGSFFAYFIYSYKLKEFFLEKLTNRFLNKLIVGLSRKWFFDRIYTEFITQNILKGAYFFSYQNIDRGLVEQFGPYGIVQTFKKISNNFISIQNGSIFHYLTLLLFSIYLMFLFLI